MSKNSARALGDWVLRQHPRLAIAGGLAIVVWLLLPRSLAMTTRIILGLDSGYLVFLALILALIVKGTPERLRHVASMQDEGLFAILALTVGGVALSLAVIVLELNGSKGLSHDAEALHVVLAVASMACAWFVVHTLFALHYAHSFYDEREPVTSEEKAAKLKPLVGGLDIPGCEQPVYWDFLYFSFTVGMTCQTSDVEITDPILRRLVLGHSILAFLFNTVILALAINVAASLL